MTDKDKEERTVAEDSVLTKYNITADIVNRTLKTLLASCVDGVCIRSICEKGEKLLLDELSNVFKKDKELKKGIAFPVCVSVNNCINHFSPLPLEPDAETTLKNGDLVKLDFGAHIDGLISVVAHSLVVGATPDNKVTGRTADVILAAHYASEAVLHLFKPTFENTAVTSAVTKVAEYFNCKPVEGMLSFQLQQNRIDGEKLIQQNPVSGQKKDVEKCSFEPHEVYAMDVIISTGKGQGKEFDTKVTIFKKTDESYNLKLKCSREFFRKVNKDFGQMPFNLRCFEESKKARLGVMECVSHKLVSPYPVLWEKAGEVVAQFKYTVLVMPNGPLKITGAPFDTSCYQSDVKIGDNEEIKAFLSASASCRKKKKDKSDSNKAAAPAAAAPAPAAAAATPAAAAATPAAAAATPAAAAATPAAAPVAPAAAAAAAAATPAAAAATPAAAPVAPAAAEVKATV